MRHLKHRIAGMLFPWYTERLEQVNYNARLRQWLNGNRLESFQTREEYFRFLNPAEPIDYLEFGVYEGESVRLWIELNQHPQSRFYGFDSFEGLPEAWNDKAPAGQFSVEGKIPQINDPRVIFLKGWFQQTLPAFLESYTPKGKLVVHLDADLYSSTLYCLTMMDRLLEPGALVLFDELYSAIHEFRAMLDYTSSYRRTMKPIACVDDPHGRVAFVMQ